jgi:hypothetical protein
MKGERQKINPLPFYLSTLLPHLSTPPPHVRSYYFCSWFSIYPHSLKHYEKDCDNHFSHCYTFWGWLSLRKIVVLYPKLNLVMKNNQNSPSSAEIGAGVGLLLVCIICMIIDHTHIEIYIPLCGIGTMILTGTFSGKAGKKCAKKSIVSDKL